ncbi:multimerin-1-like isoform X2 [Brienomyrus brachyistius]|uniref:multimerin-1-like isoform X2 n=1 Tax=Brienomyrus brachyistius TaxID=42636 RepID=UPI0020B3CBA4|nr:multimerin-1-like isoform X2 [Brienomyrus brachyistius]
MVKLSPEWNMKRVVLLCLLIFFRRLYGLGTDTYNETSEQMTTSSTATSFISQNVHHENESHGGPRGLTPVKEGPQLTKSKTAEFKILYVTNRSADFIEHGQAMKETADIYAPPGPSQDTKDHNAFRGKSLLSKIPDQTYNRRGVTSFKTSRPRNWCAYVHTRLSPTVVADSIASLFPIATDPCYLRQDGCRERYQAASRPIYRMRNQIVTSLEWKCCPEYQGPQCQPSPTDTPTQPEQADEAGGQSLNDLVKETALGDRKQMTVINKEMADVKHQGEKMLTLQKPMVGMSTEMDSMKKTPSAFQQTARPGEEHDVSPITMETLKSEAMQEMFKEIVQEQIQAYESAMQKSTANIFKTMSRLSLDLMATKANLEQINEAITKLLSAHKIGEERNKKIANEIDSLRDQISSMEYDAVNCTKETKKMFDKCTSLEDQLHLEKQKRIFLFNSLNYTLSQVKEIQSNSLIRDSAVSESQWDNNSWTQPTSILGDVVRNQTLSIVQLQQELQRQEMRIENITSMVGQQKHHVDATFETLTVQRKQDMGELVSHIRLINQTLWDRVRPIDVAVNAIEEKVGQMSNDLKELVPLTEKLNLTWAAQNDNNEVTPIAKQLEDLTAAVTVLNMTVTNLEKMQDEMRNQSQETEEEVKEKLKGCQDGIEDALNDTMTVINSAIDSVKDDYYILQGNIENANDRLSKIHEDFTEKFQSLLDLQVDIDSLNTSVLSMQIQMEKSDAASNVSNMFLYPALKGDESNKAENLTHLSHKLHDVFSKLENHQTAISHLQKANSSIEFGECRMRLRSLEVMMNALGSNITSVMKPKKKPALEPGLAWKYKDLSKQVQDLDTKTFNLSHEVLWLKGSTSQAWLTCRNVSAALDLMHIYIPQIFQEHINLSLLHRSLSEVLHPESQDLNNSALGSNPTAFLTSTLTYILQNISLLQRHAQELDRRMETIFVPNSTVSLGRNQQDTDTTLSQEATGCHSTRCQNGGTCIEVQAGSVCACRFPFSGMDCTLKLADSEAPAPDFSKGSYRYTPMVTFFAAHTYAMTSPGQIRFNHLYVNYGTSFSPGSGMFAIPYLGVYVFKYTVESSGPDLSGYLVVDEEDKLSFRAQCSSAGSCVTTGDAVLELNLGQRVWLKLETGSIPARYPPVTTFGGYLLYRT